MGEVVNLDQYRKQRRGRPRRDPGPRTPTPRGETPPPADKPLKDDPGSGGGAPEGPGGPGTAAAD